MLTNKNYELYLCLSVINNRYTFVGLCLVHLYISLRVVGYKQTLAGTRGLSRRISVEGNLEFVCACNLYVFFFIYDVMHMVRNLEIL